MVTVIGLMFFVVGMSEYIAELSKHYGVKIKPFNCSFCLTFWIGLPILNWYIWGIPYGPKELMMYLGYLFLLRQIVWRHLY
jgi:hypothetical protein